jgi:hypothetical protein
MRQTVFIDEVKIRLGIFYDDPIKDLEIQEQINSAQDILLNAGWKPWNIDNSSSATAVSIIIKNNMSENYNKAPSGMLLNLISQNRY